MPQVLTLSFSFLFQPPAVSITGLGTFCIQKWQALEDGKMLTFQRPLFSLSEAVAQIRDFRHPSIHLPGKKSRKRKILLKYTCSLVPLSSPRWLRQHSGSALKPEAPGALSESAQLLYESVTLFLFSR